METQGTLLTLILSLARVPSKCLRSAALAWALSVMLAAGAQAQVLYGPPPDTTWVDSIIYEYTPPPSSPRLLPGGSVDSLIQSGLDCSGFPTICTFVEALDGDGFPVGELTADSFCVFQDGVPIDSFSVQQIDDDSCYTSVCLVVDVSGSMTTAGRIDSAKSAMHRFVDNMDPFDRVAIVSFASCVDTVIVFTSDTAALHSAITGLTASGNTAAFDGVWLGVSLTTSEIGSKAVIAFTDGVENRSHLCWPPPDGVTDGTYADDSALICNLANGAGIPIYTFNLGAIADTYFNPEAMQAFATGTGGSWDHAPTSADIDSAYAQIKRRICSRYAICYTSLDTVANGDWHTTKVCYYNAATDSCGPCDTASCQEKDVPKIVRTPPTVDLEDTCQSSSSAMTICTYVTDADTDPEDLTVRLFYRTQAGSYTDVVMTLQPDDSTFCFTIPAAQLTCKEFVEYFITASDGISTVSNPAQNPLTNPYHVDLCFHPPVALCPGDGALNVCTLAPICLAGFSASDADGDLVSVVAVGGTLSGDTICFVPVVGVNTLTLTATDACGRADTCTTDITVALASAPQASCHNDTSVTVCSLDPICLPGFACSGADSSQVLGGTLSGDTVCFTPVAGVNTLTLICYGPCDVDTCTTDVTVTVIPPPPVDCPGDTSFSVCDLSLICLPGFTYSGGSATVVGGTLSGDTVCFTPVAGANSIKLIVSNACGADTCETIVHVTLIGDPVATCPGNSVQMLCDPGDVMPVPGFSYANGTPTVIGGTLNAGSVTITNPVAGPNVIKLICDNSCGADTCETVVDITLTGAPVATCPANSQQTVCDLSEVQPVPGFSCSDGMPTVIGGTLNAGSVTITNPVAGPNLIKLICTNSCAADTCETVVDIAVTGDPVASCPGNSSQTVCTLGDVTPVPGFSYSNGTPTVIGGTFNAGSVTLTNPVAGPNVITLVCANDCDTVSCQTTVTINVQEQPECPEVPDTTAVRICEIYEYCLDLGTPSIGQNGYACQVVSGPGSVQGGQWCYTPASLSDTVTVTVACDDDCSNDCQTTFTVAFYTDNSCGNCPQICIDTLTALPNSQASVCITVAEGGIPWGGFDFLIGYDPSLLTFIGADPGQFLIDCDWEYFTYRIPGQGKVRLVAIADMNNSNDHPLCLTPGPGDVIACLNFKVTGDWTLACRDALVQWTWEDCADNAISNPHGDTLYIASGAPGSVVNFEGTDLTGQPGLGGPPFPCPSDKGVPQECTHFCGGKIRIICPGEIDDRGDLNLNSVAYEIADAVLYSNYFILGPSVFTVNYDGQAAASDVNADGVPLTVADLVYLIRVITGDALPIADDLLGAARAGERAGSLLVSASRSGDLLKVEGECDLELGGALFVFDPKGADVRNVVLGPRASTMDVRYATVNGSLRVLLYNIEDRGRVSPGDGEFFGVELNGEATPELVSVEAATFGGAALDAVVATRVVPATFALHPNTPNPFNPATELTATFPHASDYTLTIYNLMGQVVTTFRGGAPAGRLSLTWDGRDPQGRSVASGVYFYALRAGDFSAMRKMVLMK